MFGYFYSLAIGIVVLLTIFSFHRDSADTLRKKLEALGMS